MIPILRLSMNALFLYTLSFLAFSRKIKQQVIKEQKGRCDYCGIKPKKLEIHHIIPKRMGGSDEINNAVGLCPNCHQLWDELTFQKIFYGKKQTTNS